MCGIGVFYKDKKFDLVKQSIINLAPNGMSFLIGCHLKWKQQTAVSPNPEDEKPKKKEIMFAETHLKAMPEFVDKRVREVKTLMREFAN